MKNLFFFAIFPSLFSLNVFAHSGGTDSSGCHNDNTTENYHCHNGGNNTSGSTGRTNTSSSNAPLSDTNTYMYECIDSDGNTTITDMPCRDGTKAKTSEHQVLWKGGLQEITGAERFIKKEGCFIKSKDMPIPHHGELATFYILISADKIISINKKASPHTFSKNDTSSKIWSSHDISKTGLKVDDNPLVPVDYLFLQYKEESSEILLNQMREGKVLTGQLVSTDGRKDELEEIPLDQFKDAFDDFKYCNESSHMK
jgi:hypothetical protein